MINKIFLLTIFFASVYFNSNAQTKKETEDWITNKIETNAYSDDVTTFEYKVSFENCKLIIWQKEINRHLSDTAITISEIPLNLLEDLEIVFTERKPSPDFEYWHQTRIEMNFNVWTDKGVLRKYVSGKYYTGGSTSNDFILFRKTFLKDNLEERMVEHFSHLIILCGGNPLVEENDDSPFPELHQRFWRQKVSGKIPSSNTDDVIHMQKMESGVYEIPVMINDVLKISFIFDSGASDVSISPDVAATLMRTGTVKESDFIGSQKYSFGDGSTAINKRFIIRKLSIGNHVVTNVTATISNSINAPMLLGQSVQQKFGKITIDNTNHTIIFGK